MSQFFPGRILQAVCRDVDIEGRPSQFFPCHIQQAVCRDIDIKVRPSQFFPGCIQQAVCRNIDIKGRMSQFCRAESNSSLAVATSISNTAAPSICWASSYRDRCFLLLFVTQLALKGFRYDVRLVLFFYSAVPVPVVLPAFSTVPAGQPVQRQSLFFQFVWRCNVDLDAGLPRMPIWARCTTSDGTVNSPPQRYMTGTPSPMSSSRSSWVKAVISPCCQMDSSAVICRSNASFPAAAASVRHGRFLRFPGDAQEMAQLLFQIRAFRRQGLYGRGQFIKIPVPQPFCQFAVEKNIPVHGGQSKWPRKSFHVRTLAPVGHSEGIFFFTIGTPCIRKKTENALKTILDSSGNRLLPRNTEHGPRFWRTRPAVLVVLTPLYTAFPTVEPARQPVRPPTMPPTTAPTPIPMTGIHESMAAP